MKQMLKKLCSAVLCGAMMLSAAPLMQTPQEAEAAGTCVIDTGITYQTIRGFGGMNHPEWQGYDLSDANIQTAFGNGPDELGLTVLRIFVNDDSNQWSKCIPAAKKAQAKGATVFATPWNPPAAIRTASSKKPTTGAYVLNSGAEAAYAQHLNNYVKYVEGQGVNLYSVSVQNEPDYSEEWTYWSPDRTTSFIANYGKAVKDGTHAKLMSPESFQYGYEGSGHGKMYYKKILENSAANANCDLFGTHFYGTQRDSMNYATVKNSNKEIWMTEVYVPNSSANSANNFPEALCVAENIHNGLVVGNMSAYVWWYIRRSYSLIGQDDGKVTKRGAMMAQYSKWIRPGAVRIAATEFPEGKSYTAMNSQAGNWGSLQTMVSAYKQDDKITVVAINPTPTAKTQDFSISSGEKISEIEAYHTTSNENFRAASAPSFSDSSFSASLPAQSVTTFVISTGEEQPDPNGYLFHYTFENNTDGFSGRGSASVANSSDAYAGSQSLSCTGREASWNGATHALPSKLKAGETYAFSAVVKPASGADTFHLTLEYKDSSGETYWPQIASVSSDGDWAQLYNGEFKIPADATNIQIYVEAESTDGSFLVDEVIGAPAGTQIDGPKGVTPVNYKLADLNGDGKTTAIDLTLAKRGVLKGFSAKGAEKAADVDLSGVVDKDDIDWFVQYLTGQTHDFPAQVTPPPAEMRTITPYTAAVKDSLAMYETDDSKTKKSGVTYPEVKKEYYFSTAANKNKPYNIMLPANYSTNKKYPVLYLLHGYYEDEDRMILKGNSPPIPTPQIITNAIAEGAAKEMIVVVPLVFTSATMNGPSGMDNQSNAAYDAFVDDIVDSLMPHIESKYSVATGRANTAVTGFSMGGRESLLIGMKHADKFGYIGAICPAPGVSGDWTFGGEDKAPSLILLTAGDNDQTVYSTPSGYHDSMTQKGTPHLWQYIPGGYHGDNCIRAHVYNFVRMIFKA